MDPLVWRNRYLDGSFPFFSSVVSGVSAKSLPTHWIQDLSRFSFAVIVLHSKAFNESSREK